MDINMTKCVFCNFKDTFKDKIILENDFCFLVEFFEGVPKGSGLIMPKQHRETVFDLTIDEWAAI